MEETPCRPDVATSTQFKWTHTNAILAPRPTSLRILCLCNGYNELVQTICGREEGGGGGSICVMERLHVHSNAIGFRVAHGLQRSMHTDGARIS
jgi:hypothetical protein